MGPLVLNVIHRPEMVPEYSATVTGQGKEEDIGDKALITESLDIFKTQQRLAHENGNDSDDIRSAVQSGSN